MTRTIRFFGSLALAASIGLIAVGAKAQDEAAEGTLIDPAAEERLRAMSDYLADADTLQFVAVSFFDEVQETGIQIKRFIVHDVSLARPDRLAFTTTFDDGSVRQGWYDGATLTVAVPEDGRYVEIPAGDGIDAMLDTVQEDDDLSLPLADILYSDFYAAQEPYILSAAHLGERTIQDITFDHISVESVGNDWQVWIETTVAPIPRRLVMQFVEAEGQPEYMATFHRWAVGDPVDWDTFIAAIPDDWERMEPSPQ